MSAQAAKVVVKRPVDLLRVLSPFTCTHAKPCICNVKAPKRPA